MEIPEEDEGVADPMRTTYRVLSREEQAFVRDIEDMGSQFFTLLTSIERVRGKSREVSLAKTKIEEAVMWSVKEVSK
jgi:hypothetical protein